MNTTLVRAILSLRAVILIPLSCLAIALALLLLPATVRASHCTPHQDGLQDAEVIFSGRVLSITPEHGADVVLFRVSNVWKGEVQSQAVVYTGTASRDCGIGNCGYKFKTGQDYLVFAYIWNKLSDPFPPIASKPIPFLMTDYCSRTDLLSQAGGDLNALGPSRLPSAGSGIPGRIEEYVLYPLIALVLVAAGLGLRRKHS